jgi:hypothetical protein
MKIRNKQYVLEEWVSPEAFPFILPIVNLYVTDEITLSEAYAKIDAEAQRFGYMDKPLYERFNLAVYLRTEEFPKDMITIPYSMVQGNTYNGELCLISQPHGMHTLVLIDGVYKLRYVNKRP